MEKCLLILFICIISESLVNTDNVRQCIVNIKQIFTITEFCWQDSFHSVSCCTAGIADRGGFEI